MLILMIVVELCSIIRYPHSLLEKHANEIIFLVCIHHTLELCFFSLNFILNWELPKDQLPSFSGVIFLLIQRC